MRTHRLGLVLASMVFVLGAAAPAAAAPSRGPAFGASVLRAGETLTDRGELQSPSGEFTLAISEGDLILGQNTSIGPDCGIGTSIWDVNALADPPARYAHSTLTMQRNGNLVLRDGRGSVLWQTHTSGTGRDNRMVVLNRGAFQVRTAAGKVVWGSHTTGGLLVPGEVLASGHYLRYRQPHTHRWTQLTMRRSGRLVLTVAGERVWRTRTAVPGSYLRLARGGDLTVWSPGGKRLWHTDSGGHAGGYLLLYDASFLLYVVNRTCDPHLAFHAS